MKKQIFFWLSVAMLALPLCGFSQTWSKEEQAFLDYYTNKLEQISNKPITWEHWKAIAHPDDKLTWWFTDQGMPNDLNAVKTWTLNREKQGLVYNYLHFRPIKINIVGDVCMIWCYEYGSLKDNAGKVTEFENKCLIIFKRDGVGWKFLGGMLDPVTASN